MTDLLRLSDFRGPRAGVYFNRGELSRLLALYSSRVAKGEWRDYALDHGAGRAAFSVFRHALDRPLFAIVKSDRGGRTPEYAVYMGPRKLADASRLEDALAVFERRLELVVDH